MYLISGEHLRELRDITESNRVWRIMVKDILVDSKPGRTRVAILEDGELAELHIESAGQEKLFGNIYRGRVERVFPGMQCAFIDIGMERNAFLYAGDAFARSGTEINETRAESARIENLVAEGQEITVQVIKEAIDAKGPRVTTNITLPGRNVVLSPAASGIGVSRKIKDSDERERLKNIAGKLCPEGMGLIVRTAAEGIEAAELEDDISFLLKLWEGICRKEMKGTVPRCIYREPGVVRKLARDVLAAETREFILNNHEEYEGLLGLMDAVSPEIKKKIKLFYNDYDLFEYYHVESAIQRALSRKVWLKSGGYLIFDKAEALTVIDVNTGKYVGKDNQEDTILKTNLEAAHTIARQIRLRNISGIILADFIDMKEDSHREQVLSCLKEATKQDGSKVMVLGMTRLGLVEMTRKKVRNTLQQELTEVCPMCGGSGRVKKYLDTEPPQLTPSPDG